MILSSECGVILIFAYYAGKGDSIKARTNQTKNDARAPKIESATRYATVILTLPRFSSPVLH